MSTIDTFSDWVIDRYLHVKARLARSMPRYLATEINSSDTIRFNVENPFEDEEEIQKLLTLISWIYSDINLIASETAAQRLRIMQTIDGRLTDIPNHPLAKIFEKPNTFMSKSFLFRYSIYWLNISNNGAFWFLAPERGNSNKIKEIWPINSNRITPVKDPNHYVRKFLYRPKNPLTHEEKGILIDASHVVWIRYPNPWDYWGSLPPLRAALFPARVEKSIEDGQQKFYGESRGIPLSLVSLDENLGRSDFERAKAQIKRDWEDDGTTIAVAKAGKISIQSLGFSQAELDTIKTQEFTRDKIDSIFFGYPIRSEAFASGEGIKQVDRLIKEKVVFPLHILLQEAIEMQILRRFYGDDDFARFNDVRTTDRALTIQERMINARWHTMDQMLAMEGEPALDIEMLPGIGTLPVGLANNASFVAAVYGLQQQSLNPALQPGSPKVGNLTDSQHPQSLTNQIANQGKTPKQDKALIVGDEEAAIKSGVYTELSKWRTVAKRSFNKDGDALLKEFTTEIISDEWKKQITELLQDAHSQEEIDMCFKAFMRVTSNELA